MRLWKPLGGMGGFAGILLHCCWGQVLVLLGCHQYWLFVQNAHQGVLLTWCCYEPVPDRKTLREGKADSVSWFQSIMDGRFCCSGACGEAEHCILEDLFLTHV